MRRCLLLRAGPAFLLFAALVVAWQNPGGHLGPARVLVPAFVGASPSQLGEHLGLGDRPFFSQVEASSPPGTREIPEAPAPRRTAEVPMPELSARSAVVMDAGSGEVLFMRAPHRQAPPASLTKIASTVVALELGDLDQWVTVDAGIDGRNMGDSSVVGLQPGDQFILRDLLYGLMLPSGNDAALAVARHISGSDAAFVAEMNALAAQLGMHNTTFVDPHGLGGGGLDPYYADAPYRLTAPTASEGVAHISTAYDLALLARYAMAQPEIAQMAATPHWTAQGSRIIEMYTTNRFLLNYEGADGVKSGYTETAGRALVASASRDGHRVIVVLLDAPTLITDAQRLFDWTFASHCWSGQPGC